MITSEYVTFMVQGDAFWPSKVNAPFSSASDPGAIATKGRFKGKPLPYGSARFDAPKEEAAKIAYLHRIVLPLLPVLRAAGAEDFDLYISYEYDTQCAIGFTREEVKMISDLECDFPMDCWQKEEPNPPSQNNAGKESLQNAGPEARRV